MARSVRLFLIRHGETVDNVAQLYAGSRDSALTNHGYQQATRLGLHFKALGVTFTHLFSSHLQRAAKTASLVREAQLVQEGDADAPRGVPEVTQLCVLREQDFGDLEGKKWTDIQAELQIRPDFVAVETKEAMGRRADIFLDKHLLPLLGETTGRDLAIAIVSHGVFLSTLWKRLFRRLPAKSINLSLDLRSTACPSLEHLGGWSNTGYMELHMRQDATEESPSAAGAAPSPTWRPDLSHPGQPKTGDTIGAVEVTWVAAQKTTGDIEASKCLLEDVAKVVDATPAAAASTSPTVPHPSGLGITRGWATTIMTINGKDHLKGLKRTGGGVGSSRHDASQKSIESFFKRRKID